MEPGFCGNPAKENNCEGDRTNRSDTYVAREEKPESECKAVAIKQYETGKRLSRAFGFSGSVSITTVRIEAIRMSPRAIGAARAK